MIDPAPPIMTGAAVREQIDGLVVNPEGGLWDMESNICGLISQA